MTPRRVEKIQCEFFSSGQPELTDESQRLVLFLFKSESKPSEVCQCRLFTDCLFTGW